MIVIRTSLRDTDRSEEFELTEDLIFNICKWNGAGDELVKGWLMAGKPVYTNWSIWRVITPNSLDYKG
jgi:hypothetical protein